MKEYLTGFFDMSRHKAHLSPYESGVFFSIFVMIQFWNLFNTRYYNTGRSLLSDLVEIVVGKRRFSDCFSRGFLLITAVILFGQILIVNFAGNFFEVEALSAADWGWIFLLTSIVLFIPDVIRAVSYWCRGSSTPLHE